MDFTRARLCVLDGAKALHTAVKKVAGASALIQRCQLQEAERQVSSAKAASNLRLAADECGLCDAQL